MEFTPVALVFEAEWINGLALIRGLGKKKITVYSLSSCHDAIGFYSKYVKDYFVYPDPEDHPELFLDFMLNLGLKLHKKGEKGVLFPTSDLLLKILSENKESLKKYFIFTFPDFEILIKCLNKELQYKKAVENNIPVPKTYSEREINSLFNDLKLQKIKYPLIIKPIYSFIKQAREKYRTVIINDEKQLHKAISQLKKENIPFIIQEIIPGKDDTLYTLGSYIDKHGKFRAVFTGRKLRQKPPGFGICRVGESIFVPEIIKHGESLLRTFGFFGISQIEFKYDIRDNKYKLIELNPRSWSWIGLPIKMGINIPYVAFCDVLGINTKVLEQSFISKKYRWISVEDDLITSIRYKDGLPLIHLLFKPTRIYEAYFSINDPLPWLLHIVKLIK